MTTEVLEEEPVLIDLQILLVLEVRIEVRIETLGVDNQRGNLCTCGPFKKAFPFILPDVSFFLRLHGICLVYM